jgi:hypothetical protein
MNRIYVVLILLGIVVITSAGCQSGPEFAPVEGTVTKAGKPLAGAIVVFYPDSDTPVPRSTSAPTDKAGHYRLHSTRGGDDGAAVGTHRVCILDTHNAGRNLLGHLPKSAANAKEIQEKVGQLKIEVPVSSRVPPSYGRFNETPLRAEVHPGSQVIDLDVK